MRNISKVLLLAMLVCQGVYGQKEIVEKSNGIIWYGLDFSKAKLINSSAFPDQEEYLEFVHHRWNNIITKDNDKYNLELYFQKDIERRSDIVDVFNEKLTPANLISSKDHMLNFEACQEIVNKYPSINSDYLGCAFIVESFNKPDLQTNIWIVLFDPFTKRMYFAERFNSRPSGMGVMNYWLGGVRKVMLEFQERINPLRSR